MPAAGDKSEDKKIGNRETTATIFQETAAKNATSSDERNRSDNNFPL